MNKLLIEFLIVSFILAGNGFAVDYYVANHGNDNNDGFSYSSAWRTIDKINISSFQPGDSIQFRCGDEWREQLNVSNSGVSGSPITFTSFGTYCNLANRPVLSASEVITGWSQYSQNIYVASVTSDVKQLFINGLYVKLAQHPGLLDSAGEWYYNPAEQKLYLWLPDNGDPNALDEYNEPVYRIEASIRDYGVRTVPKSYIRIAGTSQYFVSLQEAYDSALHLDSIRSQSEVLAGDIIFDRPVSVTRKGGYDCGYTGKIGDMVLQGNIAVNDGTVTIGGFVLQ